MSLDVLPIWSQWGIVGVLIAAIAFIAVEFARGELVTRKQLDAVQKVADTFKDAWMTDQQIKADQADLLARMTAVADTFEHFIASLPKGTDDES